MQNKEVPGQGPGRRKFRIQFIDDRELIEVYSHHLLEGKLTLEGNLLLKDGEETNLELTLPAFAESGAVILGAKATKTSATRTDFSIEPVPEELKKYIESYITAVLRGENPPAPPSSEGEDGKGQPGFYGQESGRHVKPAFFRIKDMSVTEKIQVALKGGKAERAQLIKDKNPSIQQHVLRNPRITIDEITELSRDMSLTGEALRIISNNREWMSNHTIRYNVVKNPKTPMPTVMAQLPRLSESQLLMLCKSSDVRDQVSQAAHRILRQRGKIK